MAADDSAIANSERGAKNSETSRPPVVWTPEDAANFLGAAIKEAQRPLAEALRRQGVPVWLFLLLILIALGIGLAGARLGQQYLRRLFSEQDSMQQEINRLRHALVSAERERAALEAARSRLEARVEITAEQLTELREAKTAAEEESAALRDQLREAAAAPRQEADEMRAVQAEARSREAALQARCETLQVQVEAQRQEIERLRRNIRILTEQIEVGEEEREALRKQARAWREWLKAVKENDAGSTPASEPAAPVGTTLPAPTPSEVAPEKSPGER